MSRRAEFLANATRCLVLAKSSADEPTRQSMSEAAATWTMLAGYESHVYPWNIKPSGTSRASGG